MALFLLLTAAVAAADVDFGRALFTGGSPLKGRIRGHQAELPPEVVACRNCHAARGEPQPDRSGAPRIDRALLLEVRQRRGGPPSAYTAESFCRLLRTGVDPVYVLIARDMPVYDADEKQCANLWQFLTGAKGP